MSIPACVLDALVAAGASAEAMAAAVKAYHEHEEQKVEASRAKARDRKRASRAASRNVTVTERDNEGQSVTDCDPSPPSPSPSSSPLTLPLITTPSTSPTSGARSSAKRGTRLPDDWEPSSEGWQFAVSSIGSSRATQQLARFRDYWAAASGQRALHVDWNATWRNWVRTEAEKSPQTGPPRERISGFAAVMAEQFQRDDRHEPDYDA